MAELRRVRQIVDAARSAAEERTVLYLLDEPLHGTNVVDRRVAVGVFLAAPMGYSEPDGVAGRGHTPGATPRARPRRAIRPRHGRTESTTPRSL